jgi:hypothetical protein
MSYGIRKGLEDVAQELKGIRNILSSMWALQKGADDKGATNPEVYADEYISTDECARRLSVSDQTIRNWIAIGKNSTRMGGWVEGIHYVNIDPGTNRKSKIRVPWNHLVRSFAKNPETALSNYKETDHSSYRVNKYSIDAYLNELEQSQDAEEENTTGS